MAMSAVPNQDDNKGRGGEGNERGNDREGDVNVAAANETVEAMMASRSGGGR